MMAFLLVFSPPELWAQTVVTGRVIDAQSEPVIGASVAEKGNAKNVTVTDIDGNFKLKVTQGKTIVVTYIGMVTQEATWKGSNLNIIMQEENNSMEEVVVIGYTSKARKDLTGSVGSISGAKLAAVPVASAAEALQGKISGVQVTSVDGQPGADINIRVRGATSVTQSNEPLYIIDGFQADNINDIPPSDIASIDVLKDASLTAIYGAKGGNGVVIVTTKSAAEGKVSVAFNGRVSVSHISKTLDLMNTADFARYQYDWSAANGNRSSNAKFFRANFGNPQDLDLYKRLPTHDWQDEVMGETPINYQTNVTVGGGSDKVRFNVSLTHSNDDGIIMGSGVRRTNINAKLNVKLSKNLTLNLNPRMTFRRDIGAGGNNIGSGGIIDVLRYRPTNGLREIASWDPKTVDPDEEAIFQYTNPKSDIETNTQKRHSYEYVNQVSLDWRPIKNLTLRTEFSHSMRFRDTNRFYGPMTDTGQKNQKQPVVELTDENTQSYTWTNTASYNFSVKDNHNWSFLLGQEIHDYQNTKHFNKYRYFPRDINAQEAIDNVGLGTPWEGTSTLSTPDRSASFFGQASYNYKHRYLASVTFRADGSTKFAPGNQWGYFPSVSGAWVVTEEPFMKNAKWIDMLKVRAAWGMAGNNRIDNDLWRYLYAIRSTEGPGFGESPKIAGTGEKWYGMGSDKTLANPKVKWETTTTRNLAFDMGFLGGRLNVTPEFYWNTTKDLLYKSDVITTSGYTTQMRNIGKVSNKGIELSVSGDILRGKDYVLSGSLTFGHNKMKVEKLNETDKVIWDQNDRWKSSFNDYCIKVGDEVGLIYGFVYDGLYSPDEFTFDASQNFLAVPKETEWTDENGVKHNATVINSVFNNSNSGEATLPGKIKFKDLNNDGVIDENDRTVIGNTNPKYQGGFGFNGQWKGFDFSVNFNYMLDFDINNATAYTLSSSEGNSNKFHNVLSKFRNSWRYTRDGDGECMYKNYYIDGSVDEYIAMNAGKTLWNPTDVVNKVTHSYFIEDGSFLRCQDLTIGYTLPNKITKRWGLSKLRFYASASNLFIITGYSGYDPEVDIQTGLTCGMDYNRYPRNRSFVFGANINF
jgi:TonB-linked SusC/RagA family outer membrane protein